MKGKGRGGSRNGLLPNSFRIISSCLKTVSSNAGSVASTVRSAGASVAASITVPAEDEKDQVLWAGFDKLELSSSAFKHVLLLGYSNGFQVLDVEDATDVRELVSKRDGPVTFLQMQPTPTKSEGLEGFRSSHPMLLVVGGDESSGSGAVQGGRLSALIKDGCNESQQGNCIPTPTVVRFFSLKSNSIVHVLRFRSAVYVVRCSPRIVAVALAAQIYCFDAVTLENKSSVLTYPMQGAVGVNVGYGPMALGPRWLAYASNNPLLSNTGRLSPQNLSPSPGVSPSTSPGNGNLVARYAMESSKQLAAGIINLGDMGYKTLSKYCQDLLPDGSNSPISSNSGRKIGKLASSAHYSESDNAGMVVIKDFVSKDIISQFRAHTSPISALCFDPTGTLLVTASIHGNNINVFRIMPNSISNSSNSARFDWTSSHVHLYKLYRGLTTAVIQDISFSQYSQWISIISSRGTCHIYVLSPFGGDAGLQTQSLQDGGPILVPSLSLPWWSTSSCLVDHHFYSPPPPITILVVSRIKNGTSGWLNTVSSVAASAAGKLHVPSGAVAAVFHNSIRNTFQKVDSKAYPLEQLLVYSPSGHVIQYDFLPSSHGESCENSSRAGSGSLLQIQDEELRVNAEPVQWWDVCRRLNWPERDEYVNPIVFNTCDTPDLIMDTSDCKENGSKYPASSTSSVCGKILVKAHERPNWYLSNAEVRGGYEQLPIWQKSKVCFYTIIPPRNDQRLVDDSSGGEIEIEKILVQEVEIRQKDLLPVFQHFHSVQSGRHDTDVAGGRYPAAAPVEIGGTGAKLAEDRVIQNSCASKQYAEIVKTTRSIPELEKVSPRPHESFRSLEKPGYCGFIQNPDLLVQSAEAVNGSREISIPAVSQLKQDVRIVSESSGEDIQSFPSKCTHDGNSVSDDHVVNSFPLGIGFSSVDRHTNHLHNGVSGDVSTLLDLNTHSLQSLESPHFLQEGYCKLSELDDCHDSTEAVTDADSNSSHYEREKVEEDGDHDELLGGIFAFSEEG